MPHWKPEQKWLGQDAFIIGGGNSLKTFDFDLLKDELTIGCNTAYILGSSICKICFFGDFKWFEEFKDKTPTPLSKFDGAVFTSANRLYNTKLPWLYTMPRESNGLYKKALGWNKNTGASAVNLALILGAKRVFLLGFDMDLSEEGRPNWHNELIDKPNSGVYSKFVTGFNRVAIDLPKKFPGREIINVTDESKLNIFPKVSVKEFWDTRKGK